METASRWRFRPAMRDGVAIASRVQLVFHFEPPQRSSLAPPSPLPCARRPRFSASSHDSEALRLPPPPLPSTSPSSVVARTPAWRFRLSDSGDRPARGRAANASETRLARVAHGRRRRPRRTGVHARVRRARGQDVEFTVGVPINEAGNLHGSSCASTHFIIPELVESCASSRAFDPRRGGFAVAGSGDYELESPGGLRRATRPAASARSGSPRAQGPPGESTHVRGRRDLQDRRLRAEPRRAARIGDGPVRGTLRYQRHLSAHDAGVFRDLVGGRRARTTTSPGIKLADSSTARARRSRRAVMLLVTRSRRTSRRTPAARCSRSSSSSSSATCACSFTGFLLDVQEPLQTLHDQRGSSVRRPRRNDWRARLGHISGTAFGQRQEANQLLCARRPGGRDADCSRRRPAFPTRPTPIWSPRSATSASTATPTFTRGAGSSLRGGARSEFLSYDVLDKLRGPGRGAPVLDQSTHQSELPHAAGRRASARADQVTATSSTALLPRASAARRGPSGT